MRIIAMIGFIAAVIIGWASNAQMPNFPSRTESQALQRADLPDYGAAPELLSTAWLNSDKPLRLASLRGQVVLLEFWTFGCINCQNTLPYMQEWYTTYQGKGLAVIGSHYPEYSYERDILNVAGSLEERGITYPIAQDNDGATWAAYSQRYWPTIYLIDKVGHIRYRSIGEGNYNGIETAINDLLAEEYPDDVQPEVLQESYVTPLQSVSVYLNPVQDSQIIGSIHATMAFVVLESQEGWYKIAYNDLEGYIAADPEHVQFVAGSPAN